MDQNHDHQYESRAPVEHIEHPYALLHPEEPLLEEDITDLVTLMAAGICSLCPELAEFG